MTHLIYNSHTVDGRNPANQVKWRISHCCIYKMFYTSPVASRISSINSMEYNMYICKYTCCAQLKTCRRIGGWNDHSGHSGHSTHRSAIVFWRLASWQGKCTRHGFTLRSTCIRRKLVSNTKSGPKNRVNFRTYNLLPRLLRAGLGGYKTGLATQLFLLLPYHLGLNIWSAWPQLQRFSVCQTGFTTKGSTCSKFPCAIIIICYQHSYYDYKHTHTVYSITISGALF